MDKQLWSKVEALFHQALEQPASVRKKFVLNADIDPPELRLEVLSLLENADSQCDFLEQGNVPDWSDALGGISTVINDASNREQPLPDRTNNNARLIAVIENSDSHLQVKRMINRGGMGTVFEVFQENLQRLAAVKVLSDSVANDKMRSRFITESQATAKIRHDNVVSIFEVVPETDSPFFVMELIEGPSLKQYLADNQRLRPKQAAEFASQIANGLVAAHENGLIHRDVKPANVLLEPITNSRSNDHSNFRLKLIDFGLARQLDVSNQETQDQLFAGTLAYMSPEQITSPKSIDVRSDIYSLGMTLYQMLTGYQPFHKSPHLVIREIETLEPPAPRTFDDKIPRDLESICLKALQKDRNRRYQTSEEFQADLIRFLDGQPTIARPIPIREKATRWVNRNKKLTAFATVAAVSLTALTIGSLIFAYVVNQKSRELAAQKDLTVESRIQRIVDAAPGALLPAIREADSSQVILDALEANLNGKSEDLYGSFNSAIALSILDSPKTEFILSNLDQIATTEDAFQNIQAAIKNDSKAIEMLKASLESTEQPIDVAKRTILLAHLGELTPWVDAATDSQDMSLSTEIIQLYRRWHGNLDELVSIVEASKNDDAIWPLSQALQLFDQRAIRQSVKKSVAEKLNRIAQDSESYTVVANVEALHKLWKIPFEFPESKETFHQLDNGIRMVRIEPAESMMGRLDSSKIFVGYPPHRVTISKPFLIADAETTVGQFLEFVEDVKETDDSFSEEWQYSKLISPTDQHPIQTVNWVQAVKFCNWLSVRHGYEPVYQQQDESKVIDSPNGSIEFEDWTANPQANGFRLPTEHEFELACRDGTTTLFYYGQSFEFFDSYGIHSNHTRVPSLPVRSRLPNRNGIFDFHGNVWEWTSDWFSHLDDSDLTDPIGPDGPDPTRFGRTIRGGGIANRSGNSDSEARGRSPQAAAFENLGFRIARNAE